MCVALAGQRTGLLGCKGSRPSVLEAKDFHRQVIVKPPPPCPMQRDADADLMVGQ